MHEMSIALEVCRIAEEQVGSDALPAVRAVGLEVGEQAGIEIGNLVFCLETLLAAPPFTGAAPVIERRPGDVLRVSYLEVEDGRPHH